MLFRCLCILSGAYSLGLLRSLPADDLFLALLILAGISFRLPATRCIAWFMLGFATMWVAAWSVINDRLDPEMQGD